MSKLAILHTCHIKKRFKNLFSNMSWLNWHKKLGKHDARSLPKEAKKTEGWKIKQRTHNETDGLWKYWQRRCGICY